MPSIGLTELASRLLAQARQRMSLADRNKNGVVESTERAQVPADLKDTLDAWGVSPTQGFGVEAYAQAYDKDVKGLLEGADANGDGTLTTTEQRTLPPDIRDDVDRVFAATPTTPTTPTTPSTKAPFGISGTIGPSKVKQKVILSEGLSYPTSGFIHPKDGSLWVFSRDNDGTAIIDNAGKSTQRVKHYEDHHRHHLNNPVGVAFSPIRNEFAVALESNNEYGGHPGHGNHFMGPTLFPADRSVFNGSTESHLDMLHHSPYAMGIAAGVKPSSVANDRREYWVFNGKDGAIDRYFFNQPHVMGGDDHHDGVTYRYGVGQVRRKEGVPSHMVLDPQSRILYVADTGNGRVAALDTTKGTKAQQIAGIHGETPLHRVTDGAPVKTVASGLVAPSGLLLADGHLVVSDHGTGHIKVFTPSGELKGDLDTGLGPNRITGLVASPNGGLYVMDTGANRLLELTVG